MSFTRAIVAFVTLITGTASWLCASPLVQEPPNSAGPLERRATTVTAQNPVPRPTRVVMPQSPAPGYPIVVALRVTLDEQGRVGEVRALGPGEIYSFYVSRPMGAEVLAFGPATDQMPPRPEAYRVLEKATMNAVRQWQYERPLNGPIVFNVLVGFEPSSEPRLFSNGVTADQTAPPSSRAIPLEPVGVPGDWEQGAVRVGNGVAPPVKVKDVAVLYPPIAQSARVQGIVTLDVRVEPDGHVSNILVTQGPPLLQRPAFDTVRQWEFTPTILDGKPIPVVITVTLEFKLMP